MLFSFALSLLILGAFSAAANDEHPNPDTSQHQLNIADIINADGTIKKSINGYGSVNLAGFQMITGEDGEPRFVAEEELANMDPGGQWCAFGGFNGIINDVYALAIDGDNNVYAGGDFISAGGATANGIAKWDAATSSWSPLGTGVQNGLNSAVYALAIDGDNNVYAGGKFTSAGGAAAKRVAKWDATTSSWSPLGIGVQNGLNSSVRDLAIDGDNNVYAGGEFTSAGGGNSE